MQYKVVSRAAGSTRTDQVDAATVKEEGAYLVFYKGTTKVLLVPTVHVLVVARVG